MRARLLPFLSMFVAGSWLAAGCGGDDHPPPAGEEPSTGGATSTGGGAGTSGKTSRAGGAGKGATLPDGGVVSDGSTDAMSSGGAANGGKTGRGGAGGSRGGAGGSAGAFDGGAGSPIGGAPPDAGMVNPGMIGAGTVACDGVMGNECKSGTACCARSSHIARECVKAYSDCTCLLEGSCPLLGCDGPEDCPGAKCCATLTPDQDVHTTGCKAACGDLEFEVCKDASTCSSSGAQCLPLDVNVSGCN